MKLPVCLLFVSFRLLVSASSPDPREDFDRGNDKKRSYPAEPFARSVRARVGEEQVLHSSREDIGGLSVLPSDVLRAILGLTGIDSFVYLQGMNRRFRLFFKELPTLELLFGAFQEKVWIGDGANIYRLLPFVAKYYRTERGMANKETVFTSLNGFFYQFPVDLSKARPTKTIFRLLRDFLLHELEKPRFMSSVLFEALAPIAVQYFKSCGVDAGL